MKRKDIIFMVFIVLICFVQCGMIESSEDYQPCQNIEIPAEASKSVFVDYYFPLQLDKEKTVAASLALDAEDYNHIVYFVYSESKAELRYATDRNNEWKIFVLDPEMNFGYIPWGLITNYAPELRTAVTLDKQGKVHLVYTFTYSDEEKKVYHLNYLTGSSGKWTRELIEKKEISMKEWIEKIVEEGIEIAKIINANGEPKSLSFLTEIDHLSLAVDKNDIIHVIYTNRIWKEDIFINLTLRHAWRKKDDFNQKWQLEDILDTGGKAIKIFPSQIIEDVIDSKSYLHLAYCHSETGELKHITNTNDSKVWVQELLANDCKENSSSLVFDEAGELHLAYLGKDVNGKTVLKYGNNKDDQWKFYPISTEENILLRPLNLATNGKNISLVYFQEREIKENEICGLPEGWYLKVYSNLESSPNSPTIEYFPQWWSIGWYANSPLKFFELDKTGKPQFVVGAKEGGLRFINGEKESLEGWLTYSEPQDCGSPPSCLLGSPVGCKEGNVCKKRYPEISWWQWPDGKQFKTESINSVYISPQEIPNTAGIPPMCVSEEDCDDGHDCTDDVCLPEQVCSHQWQDGCCETDKECDKDNNPNTVDKCLNHKCQQVCTIDCAGKECGDDGCGGSCGGCTGKQEQCQGGKCVCIPKCYGKQCGDDGCGGSCGECFGQDKCINSKCVCQPNCVGKQCGDDGCGGSCGKCPFGETCDFKTQKCILKCGNKICSKDTGETCCWSYNKITESESGICVPPGYICCKCQASGYCNNNWMCPTDDYKCAISNLGSGCIPIGSIPCYNVLKHPPLYCLPTEKCYVLDTCAPTCSPKCCPLNKPYIINNAITSYTYYCCNSYSFSSSTCILAKDALPGLQTE